MFTVKNDEAVSPVIGVILMVATTVILSAVIAAFVFGMAGNMQSGKIVSVTATKDSATTITFTNMGGADVGKLVSIAVTTTNDNGTNQSATLGNSVGSSVTVTGTYGGNNLCMAIGSFSDGQSVVLLKTKL